MNKQLKNKYNQLEQTEIIMSESPTKQPTPLQRSKKRMTNFNETFDSSILHKQEKFALDKTLVKGIKQNDPSKIVQNGEEADLGQTANLYDEHQEISEVLVNTRKKYDHFKETSKRTEDKIQKLKKQKQKLNEEKAKIQANYSNEQMEYKKIQAYLQNINGNCDTCQYTKEVYTQISQTLKHDILFFKKNCFEANIKIVRNTNKIKSLSGQYESSKKVSSNCKSLIYSIEKKIYSKQTERYDKLSSYHDIINKKIENNEKRSERERMIESSMLQALNGKMPEEQEQRRVLAVNLVLKKMLKLKMEREMQKFGDIQNTFRKIKQHTTVKRADQFIERFINRQKHYGELLESISKSEQRIAFLKHEKQRLDKQNQQIMYDKQTIQDKELQRQKRLTQDVIVKMNEVRDKLIHNETLKNKAFAFVSKFLAAFDKISIDQAKKKLSKDKPNSMLRQTLERVNKFLDAVQKEQSEQKLRQIFIQSKDLTLPEKVKERNLRIKTLSTREDTMSSAMQDHDVAYDDLSQIQYLNHARKHIKKSEYLRNRLKTKAC